MSSLPFQQFSFPVHAISRPDQGLEPAAVKQLQRLLSSFSPDSTTPGYIQRIVLTPDFHKGVVIPIGTVIDTAEWVIPGAIGSDIGCGMQLWTVDVPKEILQEHRQQIRQQIRYQLFAGGRDSPLTSALWQNIMQYGLWALTEDNRPKGALWDTFTPQQCQHLIETAHEECSWEVDILWGGFNEFLQRLEAQSRDGQLGALGGGNHFVELGHVQQTTHPAAWHWGLHTGTTTIMVHTGSLGFGQMVGSYFSRKAAAGQQQMLLPVLTGDAAQQYLSAMHVAANIATVNRTIIAMATVNAIQTAIGQQVALRPVGDMPHNLIWRTAEQQYRHRKGAAPAHGVDLLYPYGQPVFVPGSMGDSSWVLAGSGNESLAQSAAHGAGRAVSRNNARKLAVSDLEVVLPVDDKQLRARPDIRRVAQQRLAEEGATAYRSLWPAVQAMQQQRVATPVAELHPWLTAKGW